MYTLHNNKITKLDTNGETVWEWVSDKTIYDITVDEYDTVYYLFQDLESYRISRITDEGQVLQLSALVVDNETSIPPILKYKNGLLYCVIGYTISKVSSSSEVIWSTRNVLYNGYQDIVINDTQEIFVLSASRIIGGISSVVKISPDGDIVAEFVNDPSHSIHDIDIYDNKIHILSGNSTVKVLSYDCQLINEIHTSMSFNENSIFMVAQDGEYIIYEPRRSRVNIVSGTGVDINSFAIGNYSRLISIIEIGGSIFFSNNVGYLGRIERNGIVTFLKHITPTHNIPLTKIVA